MIELVNRIDRSVEINAPADAHHRWTELAILHPLLADLESRVRRAQPRNIEHLQRGLDYVYEACSPLPTDVQIVAACHLGRLLDDAAELYWRGA